jgi:aconitase B
MQQNVPSMVVIGGHCRFVGHCAMKFHKFRLLYVAPRTRKKCQSCWHIATTTKFLSHHLVEEAEYAVQQSLSLAVLLST